MSDNATTILIRVSNPSNLPLIDYRVVQPLQGNLKDLSDQNYTKLKNVLVKRGFRVPLFIWRVSTQGVEGDGTPIITTLDFLMDGHQRQRVMIKENMQPYEVPYILIEADTESEAKAQLLEISSQYGRVTQEGLDTFDLPEADLADLSFDALPEFSNAESDSEEQKKTELMCPECGHVNSPSAFKPLVTT